MKNIKMSNGVEIPILGYGVYTIEDENLCEKCVIDAIETGYRHIDTAAIYMNEPAVGKAIKNCGVNREELFITSKLWVQDQGYDMTKQAIGASLKRLGLDYLDLYLIHEPMGDIYGGTKCHTNKYIRKCRACTDSRKCRRTNILTDNNGIRHNINLLKKAAQNHRHCKNSQRFEWGICDQVFIF